MARSKGWIRGGEEPELPFSDDDTSREAAESISEKALTGMHARVYAEIARRGEFGATDDELELLTGLSHQTVSARRNELVARRRIEASGAKRLTRRQRRAKVWVVRSDDSPPQTVKDE